MSQLSIQELEFIATSSEPQAAQDGQNDTTHRLVQPIDTDEDVLDLTLLDTASQGVINAPDENNAPLPDLPSVAPQAESTSNQHRRSVRSVSGRDLVPLLTTTTRLNPTTSNINIEDMRERIVGSGYTGSKVSRDIVLEWFHDEIDFCEVDKIKDIRAFGEPVQSNLSKILEAYVAIHHPSNTSKTWGKPMGSVFKYLARSLWPSTHRNKTFKQLTRGRRLYGIRVKEEHSQPTANRHPNTTNTQHTPKAAEKRPYAFTTPSPTLSRHCAMHSVFKKPRTMARENIQLSGTFTPFYDIIHNDYLYCVRVFLPLMTARAANKLTFAISLAQRTCSISGSYWPSTRIGTKSADILSLTQPMLPIDYAPERNNGQFSIHVNLPPDIKDDKQNFQTIHDCWGLLIPFPKRKITQTANISLTSCFGSTKISMQPARTSAAPSTNRPRAQEPEGEDDSGGPWVITEDPQSLLGKPVILDGLRWDARFKGRFYPGKITLVKQDEKDQYYYFTISFDDCKETLFLDELREEKLITEDEYNLLLPTCVPKKNDQSSPGST